MKNKLILLIGAKGRFGDAYIQYISKSKIWFKTVILYSIDDLKQLVLQ